MRRAAVVVILALTAAPAAAEKSAEEKLKALEAERDALRERLEALEAERAKPAPNQPTKRTAKQKAKLGEVKGKVKLAGEARIAWVYVADVDEGLVESSVDIRQERGRFVPGWRVVRAGTAVDFPNMDTFYHHVFSPTEGHEFDNGLYRAGERSKTHRFERPGLVDIYCDLHQHMHAEILVVPNDYFTQVGPEGDFALDAPAGERTLVFWSPGLAPVTKTVKVRRRKTTKVSVSLDQPRERAHQRIDGSAYKKKAKKP